MHDPSTEELIAEVADPGLGWEVRRAALETLRRRDPAIVPGLRARGRLPAPAWPSIEDGRGVGGDRLVVLSVCMPAGEVLSVLTWAEREDPERVLLAARLALAAAQLDPGMARAAEPEVRKVLLDRRLAFPYLPHETQSVGHALQEIHLQLAQILGGGDRQGFLDAVAGGIRAALERAGDVSVLYNPFLAWLRSGGDARSLVALLDGTLGDRSLPWAMRVSARRAFDVLLGVVSHPDPFPAAVVEAIHGARATLNARLEALLMAPDEPQPLKDVVASMLHRWSPESIAVLQGRGELPVLPVPSRRVHRDWTPATVERLSTQVSFTEVLELLAEAKEADLDRVVSALRLAPALAGWLPSAARQLDPLLRALIPSRLPVPMKSRPVPLGDMAFEVFPQLFRASHDQEPWMDGSIRDGIARALDAGCELTKGAEYLPAICRPATLRVVGDWLVARAAEGSLPLERRQSYVEALESAELHALAKQARASLA